MRVPRILLVMLFLPFGASAFERDLVKGIESVAGIYSSIYLHEVGHALAYKAAGGSNILIEVPRPGTVLSGRTSAQFTAPLSAGQRQWASVSGLLAANLGAELVLQRRGLQGSAYAQSVLGTAVASNMFHVYQYYTRIRGSGGYAGNDIDQYELAGGNPHVFSAALTAYSLWALQRMRKNDVPLFVVNLRF